MTIGHKQAPHRIGEPSPLMFHLGAALNSYAQAILAAPRADSSSFPWDTRFRADASALGPDLDVVEIACEAGNRLKATLKGIDIWQAHPYRRILEEPPVVWSSGCSRLLDYGQSREVVDTDAAPVLVVPSLINRPYILDLMENRSLLRWLARQGLRPYLLDWGAPGPGEAGFSIDDYGTERLEPALNFLLNTIGRPVSLLGYCMGGTISVGLAARRPEGIPAVATIGAPWDFSSTSGVSGSLREIMRTEGANKTRERLASLSAAFGFVPVSVFQILFALVNPTQAALKFQKLARLDPAGNMANLFVALEDWLSDGVPMTGNAADDLLVSWQIENKTASLQWQFLGGIVDPGLVRVPYLACCGSSDSIATPPVSEALPHAVPGAQILRPDTGHVGMVVSNSARIAVWKPLAEFLNRHSG